MSIQTITVNRGNMSEIRKETPPYQCCIYNLEAEQLSRNLQLLEIKSYGDRVMLEDGTILHRKESDETLFSETNKRTLCRCQKCGALFLSDYHYESDMYDHYSWNCMFPVASEEEADLLNILMDGKETGIPDFRRPYRYSLTYKWIGEEDPRPLDTEKLKEMIREKYASVNPKLLENLIRQAGEGRTVEKTSVPKAEPKLEKDGGIKDYRYMVNWNQDPPTLIRLGSFAKMEANMFVYPGVWKDMPHLNDIRVGQGCYMDYDDVSEKETMEIMGKLQEYYNRIGNEEEGADQK